MDRKDIQLLAENTIEDGQVNEQVALFVLERLKKEDLAYYAHCFKKLVQSNTVTISSVDELDTDIKEKLEKFFENKIIRYENDASLGGGLVIRDNDTVIDASIKGQLRHLISKLQE